jgi:OmpA-OmpF porin, OOP family
MKFKLLAGAAIAATLVASGASAQDTGWYGAVDLGYHWSDDIKVDTALLGPASVDPDDTWMGAARLGYRLSPHWRVELEGAYRPGDIPEGALLSGGGTAEVFSLMGNVLFDFLPDGDLSPFVGVGAGIAGLQADANDPPTNAFIVDDSDSAWAWQAIAGFSAKATDRVNVDLTYRYFQTGDFSLTNNGAAGNLKGSFNDQSVTVGIRYSFASAPPPPPPPEPAAPPPAAPGAGLRSA